METTTYKCSMSRCPKEIHHDCFLLFLQKNALDVFEDGSYTCSTKTCYSKVKKLLTGIVMGLMTWIWNLNSLSILVKWWMTEGNYAAYQGGKNHSGKLKDIHWMDLALKIKEGNIYRWITQQLLLGQRYRGWRSSTGWHVIGYRTL